MKKCDFRCFFGGYLNKIAAYLLSDKRLVVFYNFQTWV